MHHRMQFRSCITEQRNQHRKSSGWAKKMAKAGMKASFAFFWCDTVVDKALTAVSRLIRTVPTIIHRVALPPERDALICSTAKLLAPPTNTEGETRFGLSVDIWPSRLAPVFFKIIQKVAARSKDTQSCGEPDLTGGAVGQAGLIVGS